MIRAGLAAAVAALAAGVVACGTAPAPPRTEAAAYMAAHPVHPEPGMTAAVILTVNDAGFADAAALQARCAGSLKAQVRGQFGPLPGCGAWTATAETTAGRTISVSCGSITRRQACPGEQTTRYLKSLAGCQPGAACGDDYVIPMPGDYVRVRTGGRVQVAADLQLVTIAAVASILASSPDPGSSWVTTRATPPGNLTGTQTSGPTSPGNP